MKIIKKDNFDRESVSDVLIAENVTFAWAEEIIELLNEKHSGPCKADWFVMRPDDYQLYIYNPL